MKILNLGQISDYKLVQGDLVYPKETRRVIRLDFNTSGPAALYKVAFESDEPDLSEPQFLANIDGHSIIEFVQTGPVRLQLAHDNGVQVWLFTNEANDDVLPDGMAVETFTKMHIAPTRNYAQEMLNYQQEQRQRRFMAEMMREFDARLKANPGVHPVTGVVIDGGDPSANAGPVDGQPSSDGGKVDDDTGDDKA